MAPSNQVRQLRGLALPALRTAGGYFASKLPNDVAWGGLILALFTPVGSRPMARSFGSVLHELVNEPNDPHMDAQIEDAIRECATRCAPQVRIVAVLVGRKDDTVGISVQFQRSDDQSVQTSPQVFISKSDVVNLLAVSRT